MSWLPVVVDGENVLSSWLLLVDGLDHSGQVGNVNSWEQVVSVSNVWESDWILEPGLLDVGVEDGFSFTVQDSSRNNVCLNVATLVLEIEDLVFDLFDDFVLVNRASLFVIELRVSEMLVPLPLFLLWGLLDDLCLGWLDVAADLALAQYPIASSVTVTGVLLGSIGSISITTFAAICISSGRLCLSSLLPCDLFCRLDLL